MTPRQILLPTIVAADYLGVSRWTIRRWYDNGDLPGVEHRGRTHFRPTDLDTFAAKNTKATVR